MQEDPVFDPLRNEKDEYAAEMLALYGTASAAARASKATRRPLSDEHLRLLVNGGATITPHRAKLFRGRVRAKLEEMQEELRGARLRLSLAAAGVYDRTMDPKGAISKIRPDLAVDVAKDTLHGTGFFSPKASGSAGLPASPSDLTDDRLLSLAEQIVASRKKEDGS